MARRFKIFLALSVGLFTWGVAFSWLTKLGGMEGKVLGVFLMPFFALLGPLARRAFVQGNRLSGIWIIALSPVVCFVNLLFATFVIGPWDWDKMGLLDTSVFSTMIVLWIWPVLYFVSRFFVKKAASERK